MELSEHSKSYLEELKRSIDNLPADKIRVIVNILLEAYRNNKNIFIIGNGGSAATASHFACDLAKGTINDDKKRFRVIALTDNIPLMTAWGNDTSYDNIFAEQLSNLINKGDVLIGISGSGNSKNIIKAIELANSRYATTVGLTGFKGGKLKDVAQISLIVPSDSMERIEDIHLILEHLICTFLRGAIRNGQRDSK